MSQCEYYTGISWAGQIKCDSKLNTSFITRHNATDAASFEGACKWHADCRNVHQSCYCEFNVHLTTISHRQCHFQKYGSMSIRPHNCRPRLGPSHVSPGPPQPASLPACCLSLTNGTYDDQWFSTQAIKKHLREAHLCTHPHLACMAHQCC